MGTLIKAQRGGGVGSGFTAYLVLKWAACVLKDVLVFSISEKVERI